MSTEKQRSSQTIKKCLKLIQDFVGKKKKIPQNDLSLQHLFHKKKEELVLFLTFGTDYGARSRRSTRLGRRRAGSACTPMFFVRSHVIAAKLKPFDSLNYHSLPPCSSRTPIDKEKRKSFYSSLHLERITGLEPATSTLARLRSTK